MHQSSGDDSVSSHRSARIEPMCANAAFGLLKATWMADRTAAARSAVITTICITITGAVIGSVASAPTDDAFEEAKLCVAEIAERTERTLDLKRTATRARHLGCRQVRQDLFHE